MRLSALVVARAIAICNTLAFLVCIVLNYFGNAKDVWNGTRIGDVARDHPTRFSPASYAFKIWNLIFIGLAIGIVYQLALVAWPRKNKVSCVQKMSFFFILNLGLNGYWGAAFAYEEFWISWVMMLLLLGTLIVLYSRLGIGDRSGARFLKTKSELKQMEKFAQKWDHRPHLIRFLVLYAPISLYFGWICVATIANGAVVLKYSAKMNSAESFWSVAMQFIATAIAIIVSLRHFDFCFAFAVAWGILAIAVEQKQHKVVRAFAILHSTVIIFTAVAVMAVRAARFFKARRDFNRQRSSYISSTPSEDS